MLRATATALFLLIVVLWLWLTCVLHCALRIGSVRTLLLLMPTVTRRALQTLTINCHDMKRQHFCRNDANGCISFADIIGVSKPVF